jgi:hypothetical protein
MSQPNVKKEYPQAGYPQAGYPNIISMKENLK